MTGLNRELDIPSSDGTLWPPQGVSAFSAVPTAKGTALLRNARDARLFGLSYNIEPLAEGGDVWYRLRIETWAYGVQSDSIALPVLDFTFQPCPGLLSREVPVKDLKIMSRPLAGDGRTGGRALSVALFLINQINAGHVPDCERILRLHRLYPGCNG